jgi:steroid delta-isomerase-like uncharacterized protein
MSDTAIGLIEQHMSAWSKGDVEGVLACMAPDVVYEDVGLQQVFTGREGMRGFAEVLLAAIQDLTWTPQRIFASGSCVSTEWRLTGTQTGDFPGIPATGKFFDIPGVSVTEVANGLIRGQRDYWNMLDLLQQLGIVPAA